MKLLIEIWIFQTILNNISLKIVDVHKRSTIYDNIIDLATCYHGMGHIIVLGLDKKSNTFFIRRDGGSNGWDRKAYFDKYEHLDTDLISNQIKFVSFEKLFVKLFKNEIEDEFFYS